MKTNIIKLTSLVAFLLLSGGCTTTSPTDENATVTRDTKALFPHSFELTTLTADTDTIKKSVALTSATRIDRLLEGTLPLKDVFTPELLYRTSLNAKCYGPTLLYENHPDGTTPNSGELPSGDLGIWTISEGTTTQACTAAELDAKMNGVKSRTKSGLFLLASSLSAMYDNGLTLPTLGSGALDLTSYMPTTITDVAFTSVTIEYTATDEYTYNIEFTYTHDGHDDAITFNIIHKPDSTSTQYIGLMNYQIEDRMVGGNCGTAEHNITRKGSLVYQRTTTTDFSVDAREADFCTHNLTDGFDSDGLLDPSDTLDTTSNPDGWGNNYSRFIANYDAINLSGKYVYVWQAGPYDPYSRVLQIGLNDHSPVDGESYFGYAAQVFDTTATFGENLGMICNWAGPGNSKTPQLFAQREFLRFNSSTNFFEVPTGGDDIVYAPTNDCTYLGTDSFEYDRNQDDNASNDIVIVKVGATGSSELEFDLFSYTGSTVAAMLKNRGATLPTAPVW